MTSTLIVSVCTAVSPFSASVASAVTVSDKILITVRRSCDRQVGKRPVRDVHGRVARRSRQNVFVPSLSVAPTGTSLISSFSVSLPSVSVSDELMVKAADCVSSSTVTVDGTVSVGVSATALTVTSIESTRTAWSLLARFGRRGRDGERKVLVAVGRSRDRQVAQCPMR